MPVSYVSQTFKPSPYVEPLSLDLLAKVDGYKQQQFDTNSLQLQNQINTIASQTAGMNGPDREYLNSKLNNTVSGMNSLGGVDFSDPNQANRLENLATSVYADPTVLTAISSAKQIQSVQASYQKMKTDPKLIKYYSPANESEDNENIKNYYQSKQAGNPYQGKSAATPFTDYTQDYAKLLKDVKGSKYTQYTDSNQKDQFGNPLYLVKGTSTVVTEADIRKDVFNLLTPAQQDQMRRDAAYSFGAKLDPLGPDLKRQYVTGAAINQAQGRIDNLKSNINTVNLAIATETNVGNKKLLQQSVDNLSSKVVQEQTAIDNGTYHKLYDQDPKSLMYQIYSSDFADGMASRFAKKDYEETRVANPYTKEFYSSELKINEEKQKSEAQSALQTQKDAAAMERLKYRYGPSNVPGQLPGSTGIISLELDKTKEIDKGDRVTGYKALSANLVAESLSSQQQYNKKILGDKVTPFGEQSPYDYLRGTAYSMAQGKPALVTNLAKGSTDLINENDINNFAAQRVVNAYKDDELLRSNFKTFNITETPKGQAAYLGVANRLAQENGVLVKDIKITQAGKNPQEFEYDGQGKLTGNADTNLQVTYEITDGVKKGTYKSLLKDDEVAGLGVTKPSKSEMLLNAGVDENHPFTTVVQNTTNPNLVVQITTVKVGKDQYQEYFNYKGHAVPIKAGAIYPTAAAANYIGIGFVKQPNLDQKTLDELANNKNISIDDVNGNINFAMPNNYAGDKEVLPKSVAPHTQMLQSNTDHPVNMRKPMFVPQKSYVPFNPPANTNGGMGKFNN